MNKFKINKKIKNFNKKIKNFNKKKFKNNFLIIKTIIFNKKKFKNLIIIF